MYSIRSLFHLCMLLEQGDRETGGFHNNGEWFTSELGDRGLKSLKFVLFDHARVTEPTTIGLHTRTSSRG